MLKTFAIIFGIIMVLVGILGFFPEASPHGMLLGIFHVNPAHNIIHIITGIVSILCGISGSTASRIFFQVFGIIYGLVAILGFYYGNSPILGIIANNMADNILHTVIAVVSLYLGFGCCSMCTYRRDDSNMIPPRDRDRNGRV